MTSAITATTAATTTSQSSTTAQTDFSSEAFMELLVAEMQNQDPLNPMDSKEMMDQLTQLTMVSQLEELTTVLGDQNSYRVTEMAGLIGRSVEWVDGDTGEAFTGTVDHAECGVQGWTVQVGDGAIPLDWITAVR